MGVVMVFAAKYSGRCPDCEEAIKPGDQVKYVDGDFVHHADCDDSAPVERPTETCTDCWIIKPCECEPTNEVGTDPISAWNAWEAARYDEHPRYDDAGTGVENEQERDDD